MNTKKLTELYKKSKVENKYYTLDYFLRDSKELLNTIKNCNNGKRIYLHMDVSRSGMTRHFNFDRAYNAVLNITYNQKITFDPVKVGGCGMDMLWHLLFTFCEYATSKKMIERWGLNGKCSHVTKLL